MVLDSLIGLIVIESKEKTNFTTKDDSAYLND